MLGAHGALAAAFAGTVLSDFQPFSQIAPSAIWTLAMVMIPAYYSPRRRATLALWRTDAVGPAACGAAAGESSRDVRGPADPRGPGPSTR
jgi:hypothetical protein